MTSLFAKTLPKVIGDVFVATLGGLIGGSGATQDIKITPTSISLPSVGSTATLAPVAVDGNDVPTGESVYLYSTDPTHVTVDPNTYVATRVALGGASVIYGTLIAPIAAAGEPSYTAAPGETIIIDTDLSEAHYADAVTAGAYPYPGGGDLAGPLRWAPFYSPANPAGGGIAVDTVKEQILNESGVKWLRMHWSGAGGEGATWALTPTLTPVNTPENPETYGLAYTQRVNVTTGIPQQKGDMVWGSALSISDNGRLQVGYGPSGLMAVHDNGFPTDTSEVANPFNFTILDIADGDEHTTTLYMRWHTKSPGTVDRLVQVINPDPSLHPTFNASQAGVLHNGDRILIFNRLSDGTLIQGSSAEFIVSNFDGGQLATLTRQPDITGNTVAYSGGIFFLADVVYSGTFSVSQAGHIANGNLLSMNFAQRLSQCIVSEFDGTTGCKLAQYNPGDSNLLIIDTPGAWFSRPSDQTGFLEYWIDGVKKIHISKDTIGITPTGGVRPWCTAASLATLSVGASLATIMFGNDQPDASSGPWSRDVGRRIKLWKKT